MTFKECLKSSLCCCKPCKKNYASLAEDDELKTTKNNVPSSLEIPAVLTAPTGTDDAPGPTTVSGFPPKTQTRLATVATTPPQNANVSAPAVPPEYLSDPATVATAATDNAPSPTANALAPNTTPADPPKVRSRPTPIVTIPLPTEPENTPDSTTAPRTEPRVQAFPGQLIRTEPGNLGGRPSRPPTSRTTPNVRRGNRRSSPRSHSPLGSPPWVNVRATPSVHRGGRWCSPPRIAVPTTNSVASRTRSRSPMGSPPRVNVRGNFESTVTSRTTPRVRVLRGDRSRSSPPHIAVRTPPPPNSVASRTRARSPFGSPYRVNVRGNFASTATSRTTPRDRVLRGDRSRSSPPHIAVRTPPPPTSIASRTRSLSPLGSPRAFSYQRHGDQEEDVTTLTRNLFEDPKKK